MPFVFFKIQGLPVFVCVSFIQLIVLLKIKSRQQWMEDDGWNRMVQLCQNTKYKIDPLQSSRYPPRSLSSVGRLPSVTSIVYSASQVTFSSAGGGHRRVACSVWSVSKEKIIVLFVSYSNNSLGLAQRIIFVPIILSGAHIYNNWYWYWNNKGEVLWKYGFRLGNKQKLRCVFS